VEEDLPEVAEVHQHHLAVAVEVDHLLAVAAEDLTHQIVDLHQCHAKR